MLRHRKVEIALIAAQIGMLDLSTIQRAYFESAFTVLRALQKKKGGGGPFKS